MAGVGALLPLLGAPGQVLRLDPLGLIGCVAQILVGHLDIGVVGLGAHDLHLDVVLLIVGHVQTDRIPGVVPEPELRPAPADGGVHAPGDITGGVAVGVTLHNLQVRQKGGIINGAGHLADAAADGIHGLAVDVGRRRAEAPVGGPLAYHGVVVKYVSIVENHPVAGFSRQLHVAPADAGAAHPGGGGPQYVPEQDRLQLLSGHGGIGDVRRQADPLAGGRRVQGELRRLGVQAHADPAVHHLPGGDVVPRGAGLRVQLQGDGLQVQIPAGDALKRGVRRSRPAVQVRDGADQRRLVQGAALGGLDGVDAVLSQLVAAVHLLLVEQRRHLRRRLPEGIVVVIDHQVRGIMSAQKARQHGPAVFYPAQAALLPAHAPGRAGKGLAVDVCAQLLLGAPVQLLAAGGEDHLPRQEGIGSQRLAQLVLREPRQAPVPQSDAGEDSVIAGRVEAQRRHAAHQQGSRNPQGNSNGPGAFPLCLRHFSRGDPFPAHGNLLLPRGVTNGRTRPLPKCWGSLCMKSHHLVYHTPGKKDLQFCNKRTKKFSHLLQKSGGLL